MKTGDIKVVGNTLGLPNKTTAEMNAIAAPEAGMLVWNTTETAVYQYTGTAWVVATVAPGLYVLRAGDDMTGALNGQTAIRIYHDTTDMFGAFGNIDTFAGETYASIYVKANILDSSKGADTFVGPDYTSQTNKSGTSNQIYQYISPDIVDLQVTRNSNNSRVEAILSEVAAKDTAEVYVGVASNTVQLVSDEDGSRIKRSNGALNDVINWPALTGTTKTLATTDQILTAYNHTQGVANTVWTITHGLGYFPVVQSWDSSNAQIVGTVQNVSTTQLTITFATAQSGKARCV